MSLGGKEMGALLLQGFTLYRRFKQRGDVIDLKRIPGCGVDNRLGGEAEAGGQARGDSDSVG